MLLKKQKLNDSLPNRQKLTALPLSPNKPNRSDSPLSSPKHNNLLRKKQKLNDSLLNKQKLTASLPLSPNKPNRNGSPLSSPSTTTCCRKSRS